MRFIFANYLSSYHYSQTLRLYAISAFKISSYYCIQVWIFLGFSCLHLKNTFSLPSYCAVASWLVRSTPDRVVRGRVLARDIVLFLGKTLYSHGASLHPGV